MKYILLMFILFLSSCAGTYVKEISSQEFADRYSNLNCSTIGSASETIYIGYTREKVYVEEVSLSLFSQDEMDRFVIYSAPIDSNTKPLIEKCKNRELKPQF